MDFFAAEAAAHVRTRRLLIAYAFAVAAVVGAISFIVVGAYTMVGTSLLSSQPYADRVVGNPGLLLLTAVGALGIIGIAALHRMAQLRAGGGAVATSMGGVRVTRETHDPLRQRLLNVVEELAIAAGVPVPEVYVLEQEDAINAFAAGFTPADAAISVTRGALEQLKRAELQGVIGHEFSHLLNGDMRLNTRLAGPLFGLLVIATVARYLLRIGRGGRRVDVLVVASILIMALGYLGVMLGRLLQAAICRQREFLADASSVQFTRDTGGLRDALVRVGRAPVGSLLSTPEGEDLAHLFIAPAHERRYSTHPPLALRIRALDPHFDLRVLDEPEAGSPALEPAAAARGLRPVAFASSGAVGPAFAAALSTFVGNPGLDAVHYAAALRQSLPADIESALARGSTAACLWLAVALSSDTEVRSRQLALITPTLGEPVAHAVGALGTRLASLPVAQYLPLLQRALPALKSLPIERRRGLIDLTRRFGQANGTHNAREYLLGSLATRYLSDQVAPPLKPGTLALDACTSELGLLFAVVARRGSDDPTLARRAYERGLGGLLPQQRPDYHEPDAAHWPEQLDVALARLALLQPAGKELLIDALGQTILNDGAIGDEEAEMLRAVAALLHCPLPPFLPLPPLAD